MRKDITILNLLEKLKMSINFSLIRVVDYWESDLCAIGLIKGKCLVYISTFYYLENEILKYDFDLEIIDAFDQTIDVVKIGRGVTEDELVSEIKLFLSA